MYIAKGKPPIIDACSEVAMRVTYLVLTNKISVFLVATL